MTMSPGAERPSLEPALNLAWVLLGAFLVMFMQVGFAMVETGFTRAKNAVHTMAMNFVIYPIGIVGFWLVGYGIAFGGIDGWRTLPQALPGTTDHLRWPSAMAKAAMPRRPPGT